MDPLVAFRLPEARKRGLALVAADRETNVSELLRDLVDELLRNHRDGLFFEDNAFISEQYSTETKAKRRRKKA